MLQHERLRFVTANFYQLQGLRLIPLGIFLILMGLDTHEKLRWLSPIGNSRLMLPTFVAMILGMAAATAYYRRHYGDVAQNGRGKRNSLIALAILVFIVLTNFVDKPFDLPVWTGALFLCGCLVATVRADGWIRGHYLLPAAAWFVLGFPKVLPVPISWVGVIVFGVAGLTLIVCGIGDHLLITRTLVRTQDLSDVSNTAHV